MINLKTDNHFYIGQAHLISGKPCQDYAISGVCENAAIAVVTDGCSTGRHTDVGSRILALSTVSAIKEHWLTTNDANKESTSQEISVKQKVVLAGAREMLGLTHKDMLATCLYVYLGPSGGIVHLQGDGVIAYKYKGGGTTLLRYDWDDNTPFYPAYASDNYQSFIEHHGGDLSKERLSEEVWWYSSNGETRFSEVSEKRFAVGDGIRGITQSITREVLNGTTLDPEDPLEYVAVFSDGVTQIDNVDWKEAVIELLNFKTVKGEFVKRRMNRAVKDFQKVGKGPVDDIAYAVVHVLNEPEEESKPEREEKNAD